MRYNQRVAPLECGRRNHFLQLPPVFLYNHQKHALYHICCNYNLWFPVPLIFQGRVYLTSSHNVRKNDLQVDFFFQTANESWVLPGARPRSKMEPQLFPPVENKWVSMKSEKLKRGPVMLGSSISNLLCGSSWAILSLVPIHGFMKKCSVLCGFLSEVVKEQDPGQVKVHPNSCRACVEAPWYTNTEVAP